MSTFQTSFESMATGGMALSKEFFELIKAIGESKSKQEEDRIMAREVLRLKQKLEPTPTGVPHPLQTSKKRSKEFLVRLLYVEMLGHDASFGYIKAVEMAASSSLYHKRTGYLICACCLPPHHEFRFMLVNQMQRDLQSTNVLEVCGGVIACTNLITADMVPAVSNEVSRLLSTPHESATIRKKSVVCLHRFHQLDDSVVTATQMQDVLRKTLCDKDPSVMGACLNVLENMAMIGDAQPFKDLVPSLVSILKQVGVRINLNSSLQYCMYTSYMPFLLHGLSHHVHTNTRSSFFFNVKK
jgi:AP-4 complex subunit epsilon-1